jgi:hypothetical protein
MDVQMGDRLVGGETVVALCEDPNLVWVSRLDHNLVLGHARVIDIRKANFLDRDES